MSKTFKLALLLCLLTVSLGSFAKKKVQQPVAQTWTVEKANAWYAGKPWLRGCNYIPANAINQIEMWSRDTYDAKQIDKELTWAQDLGFNTMRVFLSRQFPLHLPEARHPAALRLLRRLLEPRGHLRQAARTQDRHPQLGMAA